MTTSSTLSQKGTLISVAPTSEGIVIAGDSRSAIGGQFCDGTYKLIEVGGPEPTAVSVPGIGVVYSRPPAGVSDLCQWIKSAPRAMNIESFAKDWLEKRPGPLTRGLMLRMGSDSLAQVRNLVRSSPDAPRAYAGNNLYTIVVVRYDRRLDVRYLGVVGTRFNPRSGAPEVTDHMAWQFVASSQGEVFNFGLFDFVVDHVLTRGRAWAQSYLAFNPGRRQVKEIAAKEAANALENLIDAASKTASLVSPSGGAGIGGPVDVLLLSSGDKPERIRWK